MTEESINVTHFRNTSLLNPPNFRASKSPDVCTGVETWLVESDPPTEGTPCLHTIVRRVLIWSSVIKGTPSLSGHTECPENWYLINCQAWRWGSVQRSFASLLGGPTFDFQNLRSQECCRRLSTQNSVGGGRRVRCPRPSLAPQ